MLLVAVLAALALSAPVAQATSTEGVVDVLNQRSVQSFPFGFPTPFSGSNGMPTPFGNFPGFPLPFGGAGVDASADFEVSLNAIASLVPLFQKSCSQGQTDDVVSALVQIQISLEGLGTKCHSGVYASVDINVVATQYFDIVVKLQALLQIIISTGQVDACHDSISPLSASLKVLLDFFVAGGVDVQAKAHACASLDLGIFAQVGINFGLSVDASVGVGAGAGVGVGTAVGAGAKAGVGAGAGAGVDAGAKADVGAGVGAGVGVGVGVDVAADFQASLNVIVGFVPLFQKSCQGRGNIGDVVSALAQIRVSLGGLGSKCHSGVYAHVDVNVIATQYLSILVKLQVLLKIIVDSGKLDACHDSILSLNASLKVLVDFIVSGGVDVQAKIHASAALDLDVFAHAGLDLGLGVAVNAGVGVGAGTDVGATPAVKARAGVDAGVNVLADFQVSLDAMVGFAPKFQKSCQEGKTDDVVAGLVQIRANLDVLGSKCKSGVYAHVDIDVFTSQYLNILIKLQALLKIIVDAAKVDDCHDSILSLSASLKVLLDFLVAGGVDVDAKAHATASLDLSIFAHVGINLGLQAAVSAGVGAAAGAGATAGIGAGAHAALSVDAVVSDFQTTRSTIVHLRPSFEESCKQNRVDVITRSLVKVRASISILGSKCQTGIKVHADVSLVASHFVELMIDLQALLKIVQTHNKISACHDSIVAFQAPLSTFIGFAVAGGIDFHALVKAHAQLDLGFFAGLGINLNVDAGVGAGVHA